MNSPYSHIVRFEDPVDALHYLNRAGVSNSQQLFDSVMNTPAPVKPKPGL